MNALKCLIVDDEELARMLLENYISRLPNCEVVGKCKNPLDAIQILNNQPVDLIFLDIQMPEMSGTEFLKTLTHQPMVVFTTAYREYAIESYELDVVDYLLKPFSFERFVQAVNKARQLQQLKTVDQPLTRTTQEEQYLLVKSEHKIYRVLYSDIAYIQSMREYVAYYTPSGRIMSLGSLKGLEEKLPNDQFIRIHKSYIVATRKVTALEGNMVHVGKERLPIGASYREAVLAALF